MPLERYAQACDALFHTRIQRQHFREYLAGLLVPHDRNKTLTALVGAEPITQAQTAPVQQLQFSLTESDREAEAVTALLGVEAVRWFPAEPLRVMVVTVLGIAALYALLAELTPALAVALFTPLVGAEGIE